PALRDACPPLCDGDLMRKDRALRTQVVCFLLQRSKVRFRVRELLVERVQLERRCARLRSKSSVLSTQRGSAVRWECATPSRRKEHGECEPGKQRKALARRVCLPKHGAGPYHTTNEQRPVACNTNCEVLSVVCDGCALTFVRKGC